MDALLTLIPLPYLLWAVAVTILAGFVKGAVGFGQPLVMIALMGIVIEPQLVVAAIVIPIVASNMAQVARQGRAEVMAALSEYRVYIAIVCVMILISAQLLPVMPTDILFVVIGIPVVLLCVVQLIGVRLVIPPDWRGQFSVVAGLLSGFLGGLAGTWGPPTVLYLLAVETPKAQHMAVQGVVYGLGAVMLLIGHLLSGVLNWTTLPLSAFLVLPGLLGIWLGFQLGDRLDAQKFRTATLIVLIIAGFNLIRRGVWG